MQKSSFSQKTVTTLFYIVLAAALLFALNLHNVWQFSSSHILGQQLAANTNYSNVGKPIFNFLDKYGAPVLMLFWMLIGGASYILAIWIQEAFSSARKEAKLAGYVRPAQSTSNGGAKSFTLLTAGWALGWIGFIYLFFQVLLPWASRLLGHALNASALRQGIGYLAGAIAVAAVSIYLLVTLSRLLKSNWHRFNEN